MPSITSTDSLGNPLGLDSAIAEYNSQQQLSDFRDAVGYSDAIDLTPEASASSNNSATLAAPADRRARISVPAGLLTGPVLAPLIQTGGLMFPYTPTVIFGRAANYDDFHFTHSNYRYYQFQNSAPSEIQVNGEFTAMTDNEARYSLAAIRFLQSMTLSEFGRRAGEKRGVPPPVLRFNYLGEQMFRNVPVVITQFTVNFEPDIDYVPVRGFDTNVPIKMLVTVNLVVQPNPKRVINEFTVDGFKSGALVKKGYI